MKYQELAVFYFPLILHLETFFWSFLPPLSFIAPLLNPWVDPARVVVVKGSKRAAGFMWGRAGFLQAALNSI